MISEFHSFRSFLEFRTLHAHIFCTFRKWSSDRISSPVIWINECSNFHTEHSIFDGPWHLLFCSWKRLAIIILLYLFVIFNFFLVFHNTVCICNTLHRFMEWCCHNAVTQRRTIFVSILILIVRDSKIILSAFAIFFPVLSVLIIFNHGVHFFNPYLILHDILHFDTLVRFQRILLDERIPEMMITLFLVTCFHLIEGCNRW